MTPLRIVDENYYQVTFCEDQILTLVTHSQSLVDTWISEIQSVHHERLDSLIVGLDVEWRPNMSRYSNNPVATLQLCVDLHCLIFQIIHSDGIPQSLRDFLANSNYAFAGIGIKADVAKLLKDYQLFVANAVDLCQLAKEEYGMKHLGKSGIKSMARELLEKEVEKPKRVILSRWDNRQLSLDQVEYACIDAFVCFQIMRYFLRKKEAKIEDHIPSSKQVGGQTARVNFPEVRKGGEREVMRPKIRSSYRGSIDTPHKLYAANLSWSLNSQALRQAFEFQPGLLSTKVIYDRYSGRSRGFGFITFSSAEQVESALNAMNGVELKGRPLLLKFAEQKSSPSPLPTTPEREHGNRIDSS